MTSCPTCGKPVDPLRAPAVGVRAGKVVSFCSKECAAAGESQPTKLVPTKIVRIPSQSERTATPASGVVEAGEGKHGGRAASEPVASRRAASEPAGFTARAASEPTDDDRERDESPREARRRRRRADSSSVQIADTGRVDDFITPEPRSRLPLIAGVLVLAISAGVAVAYFLGMFDEGTSQHAAPPPRADAAPQPVEAPVDATPTITPEHALTRATDVLRAQTTSDSPRVQRVAASALARTGEPAALDLLAEALRKESGDLARLDLAYALARAGDKRGIDALIAAARGAKRDPKLEAGRRLALLGDKRAIDVLQGYLDVVQLRLGIAEQLAYLAHPRALAVLDEVRADARAVPDEKARATIALGHAGRGDVIPELQQLLADDRNNAFAAVALADLREPSARPILIKQLTIPSLRVQAARALRRLDPEADVTPLLEPLVDALDSNKDTEQVGVAEAILLLSGPAAWSERE